MLKLLPFGLALALTGCKPNTEPYLEFLVKDYKDPASIQTRGTFFAKQNVNSLKVVVFCGEVNAKNSYGAYTGFKQFIVVSEDSKKFSSLTSGSLTFTGDAPIFLSGVTTTINDDLAAEAFANEYVLFNSDPAKFANLKSSIVDYIKLHPDAQSIAKSVVVSSPMSYSENVKRITAELKEKLVPGIVFDRVYSKLCIKEG